MFAQDLRAVIAHAADRLLLRGYDSIIARRGSTVLFHVLRTSGPAPAARDQERLRSSSAGTLGTADSPGVSSYSQSGQTSKSFSSPPNRHSPPPSRPSLSPHESGNAGRRGHQGPPATSHRTHDTSARDFGQRGEFDQRMFSGYALPRTAAPDFRAYEGAFATGGGGYAPSDVTSSIYLTADQDAMMSMRDGAGVDFSHLPSAGTVPNYQH